MEKLTPEQKAIRLIDSYIPIVIIDFLNEDCFIKAKKCALIAVKLHLKQISKMKLIFSDRELHYKYWKEVQEKIEKFNTKL